MANALFVPVLLVLIGLGWLLGASGILPEGVNWLWVGLLALAGGAIIAGGWNRLSAVVGPMLLLGAALSTLRQMGHLQPKLETPILVIAVGLLLIYIRVADVRMPSWYVPPKK